MLLRSLPLAAGLCRAHGIPHQAVTTPQELPSALATAWGINRHSVVEVITDRCGAWRQRELAEGMGPVWPGWQLRSAGCYSKVESTVVSEIQGGWQGEACVRHAAGLRQLC